MWSLTKREIFDIFRSDHTWHVSKSLAHLFCFFYQRFLYSSRLESKNGRVHIEHNDNDTDNFLLDFRFPPILDPSLFHDTCLSFPRVTFSLRKTRRSRVFSSPSIRHGYPILSHHMGLCQWRENCWHVGPNMIILEIETIIWAWQFSGLNEEKKTPYEGHYIKQKWHGVLQIQRKS